MVFAAKLINLTIFLLNVSLRHLEKLSDLFEKLRVSRISVTNKTFTQQIHCSSQSLFVFLQKVEGRVASDQELKLTELLRYYMRDIQAAKVRHAYLQPSDRLLKFKFLLFVDIYYHRVELSTLRFNLICPLGKMEGENNIK